MDEACRRRHTWKPDEVEVLIEIIVVVILVFSWSSEKFPQSY